MPTQITPSTPPRKPRKSRARKTNRTNTYVLESSIVANKCAQIKGEAEEEMKKLENEIRILDAEYNAQIVSRGARMADLKLTIAMMNNAVGTEKNIENPELSKPVPILPAS